MAENGALPPIPDKLLFKIGEVARLVGVKPFVLRFWESEFSQLKPGKSGSGHRVYEREDVVLLRRIRRLLHDHRYTIAGARALLAQGTATVEAALAGPPRAAANELSAATDRVQALEAEVARAEKVRRELEKALTRAQAEATFWRERLQAEEAGRSALLAGLRGHAVALRDLADLG